MSKRKLAVWKQYFLLIVLGISVVQTIEFFGGSICDIL